MLYPYPGYCGTGRTELTEATGTGIKVLQNFQKFLVRWHGLTDLTEVPGTGMGVVQNSRKFFVRVWMLYKIAEAPGNTRVNAGPQGRSSI